jgi:hypothetical protein
MAASVSRPSVSVSRPKKPNEDALEHPECGTLLEQVSTALQLPARQSWWPALSSATAARHVAKTGGAQDTLRAGSVPRAPAKAAACVP